MRIIRYSINGFSPQYQSHHLDEVDYHLNRFDLSRYPLWMQYEVQKKHEQLKEFYTENYHDFEYGIWAFIEGHKDNQSLNHLKHKVPCWSAEISDDAIVYDVNWEKKLNITDKKCELFGFYIPKSQMNSIYNIERVRRAS